METWLLPKLILIPVYLGLCWLLGIPWVLVILPRGDWQDRVLVSAFGLGLGGILLTTIMFLQGTFATLSLPVTLALCAVIAVIGGVLAWRRRDESFDASTIQTPLAAWEWAIIALIAAALLLRVLRVAYWPFMAYDPLWVYGYNAKIFFLNGIIPDEMGYYPQFVSLSYTFLQQVWGGINDHAARALLPVMQLGSVLAAYALGKRLIGRRLGLLTAFLWVFYPHLAEWSRFGDLEIALTFFFTMAGLFFLLAWQASTEDAARWRYAIAAGLMLGGALWTKPTGGAFALGTGMVFVVEALRTRFDWAQLRDRFRLIVVVGSACSPVGGMWYIRNLMLGHDAVTFPPAFWQTLAQRGGQELTLPLIMLLMLTALLLLQTRSKRPDWRWLFVGIALMVIALWRTAQWPITLVEVRPSPRLVPWEAGMLLGGLLVYAAGLWRWWQSIERDVIDNERLRLVLWIVALILPYWITWFWSYSYHPRLAFAMIPLQFMVGALLIVGLLDALRDRVPQQLGRPLIYAALVAAAVPGLIISGSDTIPNLGNEYLATDIDKSREGNFALMRIVMRLQEEASQSEEPLRIVAPGMRRLPFFFPDTEIIIDPVTDPAILDDGVTHFIDGSEAEMAYDAIDQSHNPARGITAMLWLSDHLAHEVDGTFYYDLYRIDTAKRLTYPEFNGRFDETIMFPGFAEVIGYSLTGLEFHPGRRIILNIDFHVLEAIDTDYTLYLHVLDEQGEMVAAWDHQPGDGRYPTSMWEAGTYIEDRTWVELTADVPVGDLTVMMGLYDAETGARYPVLIGDEAADGFLLLDNISMHPLPE